MGEGAAALRTQLRELVADQVPHDYLGAFSDDPADLQVAQRFCKTLAEDGMLCSSWPARFGGRGSTAWEQTARTLVAPWSIIISAALVRVPWSPADGAYVPLA